MTEPWVINASPLILLAKAGLVHLLPRMAIPLVIPDPVVEEIRRGPIDDAALNWVTRQGAEFIQPAPPEPAQLANAGIGPGERAVIAWASAHAGFVAVLDDLAARTAATRLGVPVLGTIGVLLRFKQAALIERIEPHLIAIRQVGGHISDALFHEALRRAGETPDTQAP